MYVEKLMFPRTRYYKLLEGIKKSPKENLAESDCYCSHGYLRIYHSSFARLKHKRIADCESVMTDFKVIKLYGLEPTEEEQRLYQDTMLSIFEKEGYGDRLQELEKKENPEQKEQESDSLEEDEGIESN